MEQTNLTGRFIVILVITGLLVAAFLGWGVRLGQDLRGGTTLRFSLDLARAQAEDPEANATELVATTIKVIRDRIDKFGLAEVVLTPLGEDKFEILLPAGSEGDVQSIVDVVTALGKLEFRIEVQPQERYPEFKGGTPPRLEQRGAWPWQDSAVAFDEFKEKAVEEWKAARDAALLPPPLMDGKYVLRPKFGTEANTVQDFHVLESLQGRDYDFDGGILIDPITGKDPETGKPVVLYKVKKQFQNVFAQWTGENVGLPMAIVLNEEYRSAPIINSELRDSVQISLGMGTYSELKKQAEELTTVLQTGALKVRPTLESVNKVGARLAGKSKERGIKAVIAALLLVLVFMVIFYRMQGVVADVALLLNLVLLVGTLAFFQAVLTLPGIAGIVLTLGMAIDANILICERIREERKAGRSLQRAVSEGYDRALTTIVDANVTSLITAAFLFKFGSGPVRGFAVTLAIGLVVSMFTAIFVTRTINDWLMRIGLFKEIHMVGTGTPPTISWVNLRRIFAPLSAAGVVFGLLVFATEDKYTLYDVDFTGGFKLQARFKADTSVDDVKQALNSGTRKVTVVTEEFDDKGDRIAIRRDMPVGPYPQAEVVAVGGREGVEITVQRGLSQDDVPEAERETLEVQSKAFEGYVRQALAAELRPGYLDSGILPFTPTDADGEDVQDLAGGRTFTVALVDPDDVVTPERLRTGLIEDMPYWTWRGSERQRQPASTLERNVVVRRQDVDDQLDMLRAFQVFMLSKNSTSQDIVEADPEQLRDTLAEFLGGKGFKSSLERQIDAEAKAAAADGRAADAAKLIEQLTSVETLGLSEPFPSVDMIGSTVAQKLKNDAMLALALSLIGIIAYIAFRFSSRAMGIAAVICLFHDVAITLGIVAIANMLGIVDAKINLPMVAAFLTLVGYSVNDTVVVFDRIRENRGKKRVITPDMIDLSINQTLARTVKTSITFLLVTLALFLFNRGQRNVLEGFAFLLIVGSVIGTYSTVAIAAPLLLYLPWLWQRMKGYRPRGSLVSQTASHWVTVILVPVAAVLWLVWALVFGVFLFVVGLVLFPVWALTEKAAVEPAPTVPATV